MIINSGTRSTRFFLIFFRFYLVFAKCYMYGKVEKGQKIDISRTRFLEFLLHKCIKYGYKCCEIFGMVGDFCWLFRSLRSRKFLAVGSFWYPLWIFGIFVGIGIII